MMSTVNQEQINSIPTPVESFKFLLEKLNVPVGKGGLFNALAETEKASPTAPLLMKVNAAIQQAKVTGIQTLTLRWNKMDQRRLPALVWHNEKWLLVEKDDGVIIGTDCQGKTNKLTDEELQPSLVLWVRTANSGKSASEGGVHGSKAVKLVLGELFKTKAWIRDVALATVTINFIAVATSLFAMQVYDRVVPTLAYSTLWTLVGGMAIITGLDWLLKLIRNRIVDSLSCTVDRAVSQKVFEHVMHLRLDTRPQSLGTLAAQVSGLEQVRQFFSSGVIFGLVDMPFAILFIVFISIIGGNVALVYSVLFVVALVLGVLTQARLRRLTKEQMARSNERQGMLVDVIRGTESIRASGSGWRFAEQWQAITDSISGYSIQQKDINNRAMNTVGMLSTVAYVAAIVVGVHEIESGNLTMGAMIACSILGGKIIAPVGRGVQYLAQWQSVTQSISMVDSVLELDSERSSDQKLLVPDQQAKSIELKDVRFSFPESPILQLKISELKLKAGDRVMLVGSIGSGKSTLLKMLAGQYKPTEGRVKLGDADLWETDPNVVNDQLGYLPQNVHLFKGTLRSNLALSGAVSDSSILRVSEEIGIDKIAASNPRGLDLNISEGGNGVSGGQKQIIGLGRVFLSQPNIWLLDEPTASLDQESDRKVLDAINSRMKTDDILVLSTHRIGIATRMVNRVIVMEGGEIVDDGAPELVIARQMAKRNKIQGQAQTMSAKPNQTVEKNKERQRVI
ncbi:ATP-binding cassette domain-containing protein [Vibrio sp. 10N.261.46.E12]|uniref:ATP-binding cassette domain-containing protein n=1 Tax=unclassified Vibrio TaxID=2614977 RepID=UPI00097A8F98|nr:MULTISPECIES: ATP-binding cassette domain-containing protein [unclassified Vibrio]OMO36248.1 ABC transporter ATP-binding protein [Vibrio sp. 10N.261.45.E1]PMJ34400.1 ABC transporter ATP-binding protein [Vibrio sp. 10N.286.45.B6]PML86771.1 ABC transporter ATP-binding protein [Vibrio sp. 10N.261.49.E11]PMM76771.1 ABC transporter ATP-binding protein [Vibrio sp. 10N.261.46.F12]PMM81861.1 ABC transporter ATP-binding protein [Vibrio sp. 10N.261.46.E8]